MALPSQTPDDARSPALHRLPAWRVPSLPQVHTRRSMARVLWHIEGVDQNLLERLWEDPDAVLANADILKDGDRCTVTRLLAGDDPFTLKRYNLKSTLHTAIHMPLRSRARWSWLNGRTLIRAGLPTPMPRVAIEERKHGFLHLRSFLLTEFVPGRSLLEIVQSGKASDDTLAGLARQFARIWQTLGQVRAGHGDMKASNFIVDDHGKLWLIDLDGVRIYSSSTLLRRERRNDLARFMRNWDEHPEAAAVFRARIGTG